MEPAENGELIYALPTEGQPDCVKVFPYHLFPDETLKDTIIAATYNYDEVARVRSGGLHALNPCRPLRALLEGNGGHESAPGIAVTTESLPGVLSCSWIRTPDYYGATCITSDLSVHTFKVEADSSNCDEDRAVCLHERYELFLENSSDAVGLSLTPYECSTSLFAVTASDGTVYVVEEGLVSHKWKAHEVETWSSTFQPGNPNILLTGADDSRIKVFDRRLGVAPQHTLHCHASGVTALQFTESDENVLYTGSFDRQLMRFDMRNLKSPIFSSQLEGTVWYIDFTDSKTLHIAGSYDGALVYAQDDLGSSHRLVKKFSTDNALFYGAAHFTVSRKTVYASCNFYNKQIVFWC